MAALLQQADEQRARGEYALAVTGYEQVIQRDHFNTAAYLGRGVAYLGLGDYTQALVDCNAAIHLEPKDARAYVDRAWVYERQGHYAFAIADCSTALKLDVNNEAAYAARGWAYAALGQYRTAIADCTSAIRLDAGDDSAYATRGWAYEKLGMVTRARADEEKAGSLATLAGDASPYYRASFLGQEKSCAVEYTPSGYLMLVHVRINREKTHYTFVVDTGADTNVISSELASRLKVKTLREQTSTDAGGARRENRRYHAGFAHAGHLPSGACPRGGYRPAGTELCGGRQGGWHYRRQLPAPLSPYHRLCAASPHLCTHIGAAQPGRISSKPSHRSR